MALKTCKLKMTLNKLLYNAIDFPTQGEIAEILLEEGFFNEANEEAQRAVQLLPHFNAEAIKFYCVMMRAYF